MVGVGIKLPSPATKVPIAFLYLRECLRSFYTLRVHVLVSLSYLWNSSAARKRGDIT